METTSAAITTQALTRVFKNTRAVDSLDLEIEQGELFGLVGPDGAGKTTTLRLLAGLLSITSGDAQVAGCDLSTETEAIKPKIGYMAQQFSLYGELSVQENLRFFADLYAVPKAELKERMQRLLTFAGLTQFTDRRAAKLSGGMQKKLALACTLIHEPQVLLLDEPTTGVDPVSRREFWDILTELHLQGTTILVSTPYMDEADRCSRVGLMNESRLVICDRPGNVRNKVLGELVQLIPADWEKTTAIISEMHYVQEWQTYGEHLNVLVDDAAKRMPEIEKALKKNALGFKGLRTAPLRMEEAFISLMRQLQKDEEEKSRRQIVEEG